MLNILWELYYIRLWLPLPRHIIHTYRQVGYSFKQIDNLLYNYMSVLYSRTNNIKLTNVFHPLFLFNNDIKFSPNPTPFAYSTRVCVYMVHVWPAHCCIFYDLHKAFKFIQYLKLTRKA